MTDYRLLCEQMRALAEGETNWLPVFANAAALLYENLEDINWAGFYFAESGGKEETTGTTLVLGPFQGRVACMRLAPGKGVCQKAFLTDEALIVDDVHAFPGHIACDAASSSEIVIPLHVKGRGIGVLDIDAPVPARFTESDREGLEEMARILEEVLETSRAGG